MEQLKERPRLWPLLIYAVVWAISFLVIWGVTTVVGVTPIAERVSVASASLAASSIMFGFATMSLVRLSAQVLRLNRSLSDVAKELLDVYEHIQKDKALSSKIISWSTKINKWGFSGFSAKAAAPEAIRGAYNYLLTNMRGMTGVARKILYFFHIALLILIMSSILTSILTYFPTAFQESTLAWSLIALFYATPSTVFVWWMCNSLLTQIDDSIFNIRHQINGGLADILPHFYGKP